MICSGRVLALAILIGATIGCSSTPVRYYTLLPPAESLSRSEAVPAIEVQVVLTGPELNRAGLMLRTSVTEMTLLENEQWASPLKDEIQEALRQELQRRLRRTTQIHFRTSALSLTVDVQQFEAQLGRHAVVEVSWSLSVRPASRGSDEAPRTTCQFQADEKIAAGYVGIVQGYQKEIAMLADAVVAELIRHESGFGTACQRAGGGAETRAPD